MNIHQIWIQGEEELQLWRPDLYTYCQKWATLFVTSKYILWSQHTIIELIRTYSDKLLEIYLGAPNYACQSDIARYVILYVYGGLYVDTDYEPFRNFEYLIDTTVSLAVVAMSLTLGKQQLGDFSFNNCWIFCSKECKYMKFMLNQIEKNDADSSLYNYVWTVTGPKAFGNMLSEHKVWLEPDVRIFPHTFIEISDFSICNIRHLRESELLEMYPWAIGIHRNDASWAPKSLRNFRHHSEKIYFNLTNWSDHYMLGITIIIIFSIALNILQRRVKT